VQRPLRLMREKLHTISVSEWHERFKESYESVEDDERSGRPEPMTVLKCAKSGAFGCIWIDV